ncbi:hypothetical protein [Sulfurimonas sp. C5]|uniref:hypothetical protein n=1 Tax=Sulfurimonas sp. C5 TaxID=3036947 RepID=UPI0024561EF6|nr:hypothetical protein [Sulfurimonas sp. C5]MDH4945081.1 hypothetical protein [Sulfurimonas sp. C5]
MKKEYKESSIGKFLSTVIIVPLVGGLLLWTWIGAIVVSVGYLHSKIMQYQFSAFIYKEIYELVTFYTDNPRFITIVLTLTVLTLLFSICVVFISYLIKSIYNLFTVFNKKESLEEKENTNE